MGEVEVTPSLSPIVSSRLYAAGVDGGCGVDSRGRGGEVERGRRGELVLEVLLLRDGGVDLQLVLQDLCLYQSLYRDT